jgi:hypothetical protein
VTAAASAGPSSRARSIRKAAPTSWRPRALTAPWLGCSVTAARWKPPQSAVAAQIVLFLEALRGTPSLDPIVTVQSSTW